MIVKCEICSIEFGIIDDYGLNNCPNCNQEYGYDENQVILLSDHQKELLRQDYKRKLSEKGE